MKVTVTNIDEPVRVDKYIFENLSYFDFPNIERIILSRSHVQSLIKSEGVLLNGLTVKKNVKVKNGDEIKITVKEKEKSKIVPENIPINIVYEDDDVIVINKERGMVVHPGISNYSGTLVNAILYHIEQSNKDDSFFKENLNIEDSKVRPGIVHRIDKDTTGLLMIAKNDYSHTHLSKQLKDRTVNRRYLALVHGGFKDDEGVVDAPIRRSKRDRLKMAVDMMGKRAVTHYKVIERYGKYTLLELKLETGRTHQIRVHMRYIKHPLVGDAVYGVKNCKYNHIGQLLHAKTLGFVHPSKGEYMEFDSDIPDDFKDVISEISPL